jgi:SAM-dependent methyltransferase
MSGVRETTEPANAGIVWHDLECGGYRADLRLWRRLAGKAARPERPCDVLDLGCGTGRIALDLAGRGHRVTGVDSDPRLVAELRARAAAKNLTAGAIVADVRDFALGRRFDLVLAAMQLLQLLPTRAERIATLRNVRAHLQPRGLFAAALIDLTGEVTGDEYTPPVPDMCEAEGWVWSSQPTAIRLVDEGSALALDRHRRAVSPRGEMAEGHDSVRLELFSTDELEEELREAGIAPGRRLAIEATEDHVGSVVVTGEAHDA